MKSFLLRNKFIIVGIVAIGFVASFFLGSRSDAPTWITEIVTRGTVANIVSVSGVMKAENIADLSFPVSGTIAEILVREGDTVQKGHILATLEQRELSAELRDAQGALLIARANQEELARGPREEERDVTDITVSIARENLARTKTEKAERVRNAFRTLLSEDLEAAPIDPGNDDTPPVISGSYTCNTKGTYQIDVFSSNARSGYSYRLSGLEAGTFSAYTEAAAPLGTCGLMIQFNADESYASKSWEVRIPNTSGASYVTNMNAYSLTLEEEKNAVAAAEQALLKAEADARLVNATPREEAASRAEASVIQAEARFAAVLARIEDRTLRAPFDGVVSAVDIVPGEVSNGTAMTLVAESHYELTVRIPEIDITDVHIGQTAEVIFDAREEEPITSAVSFISKSATEIDGVAYFEAKLLFDNPPEWFRSGLNADVNIIVAEQMDTLRLPKRFVTKNDAGEDVVHVPEGDTTRDVPVTITFTGNDGFYAVEGLSEGTTVVAP